MASMNKNRHPAYFPYLYSIAASGLAVVVISVLEIVRGEITYHWAILASLTVITGALAIKIPGIDFRISIEDTFFFTNLLLFGPQAGCVTAAVQGLVGSIRAKSTSRRLEFTIFNVGALALSAFLSGRVLYGMLGIKPLFGSHHADLLAIMWPMGLTGLVHYIANSSSVAIIIALDSRRSISDVWRKNFRWASISYLAGATFAALIAANVNANNVSLLGSTIPIILITYLTYNTYREKVEEHNWRLKELNELYLRTVESLALAVDAKDKKTYGHVCRVRAYAMGLARLLGIKDANELRAIETGALLHDIGKLAIEDYILNRPDRLNSYEFEKMKAHTIAGEEILKQVQFPFPVAGIVRAHHERWDGTGYPDGLKGDEIPLGGRILIIADTFDALRSSRPYKMSYGIEESVQELRDCSGTMYDPKLVDLFIRNIDQLEAEASTAVKSMSELAFRSLIGKSDPGVQASNPPIAVIAPVSEPEITAELVSLSEFCISFARYFRLSDLCANLEWRLRRLLPFSACAFFLEHGDGMLSVAHAGGKFADQLRNLRIPMGSNISGWVAAYGQSLNNSRAALELQSLGEAVSSLTHVLAVPMRAEGGCFGTITIYGEPPVAFNADHLKILQTVSTWAAPAISEARRKPLSSSDESLFDPITAANHARCLAFLGAELIASCLQSSSHLSLVYLDLQNLHEIVELHGPHKGDSILRNAAETVRGEIREKDILVRFGMQGFVALLEGVRQDQALGRAQRLGQKISSMRISNLPRIVCRFGAASFPEDGATVFALLECALQALERQPQAQEGNADRKERKVLEFPA
jgi:diguanylate cyclase (GGDEF)-like protein/putative nucleotidyltransferase with HDIG domain